MKNKNNHNHEHNHEHEHEHNHKHEHEHNHSHSHDSCDSVGACGCNDGCGGDNGHSHDKPFGGREIIVWSSSVFLFLVALFIPNSSTAFNILKTTFFALSVLIAGYDLFLAGAKELLGLKLRENSLLLIAVVASFALGEIPEACVVTILFKLGGFLESYAVSRSKKSMEALTKIRPDLATIKNEKEELVQIDAAMVNVGDTIYLRAGDKAALDCEIIDGSSSIDSSALTGEAIPISVSRGDIVLSGSINLSGLLTARATKSFENSTASQIIEMVYASSQKKGKAENLISRFAKVYTPIVLVLAVLIAVVPPLFSLGSFADFIMRALIFLVASCPCSLVISIPLSFFSSIGAASRIGVLVKGSMYMERLAKVDAVCLDKTGTVTNGKLLLDSVISLSGDHSQKDILAIAASLEDGSNHPIAKSITQAAREKDNSFKPLPFTELCETAGLGITARLNSKTYLCGGINMLKDIYDKASLPSGINTLDGTKDKEIIPLANVYICEDNTVIGAITLKEEISPDSLKLIDELKKENITRVVMLTGDNKKSAQAVAQKCGITEFYSALLPAGKVEKLKDIKADSKHVLFVGDGINDAPVLAEADVSMSMGLGSEIANASSDIVLASNRLSTLPRAIKLSRHCMGIVYFNLFFAFAVKIVVLILGASGLGTMWLAVFADIGVTILSVINSVRILKFKG